MTDFKVGDRVKVPRNSYSGSQYYGTIIGVYFSDHIVVKLDTPGCTGYGLKNEWWFDASELELERVNEMSNEMSNESVRTKKCGTKPPKKTLADNSAFRRALAMYRSVPAGEEKEWLLDVISIADDAIEQASKRPYSDAFVRALDNELKASYNEGQEDGAEWQRSQSYESGEMG